MPVHWYAIASHPNKEDVLWRQLQTKNIEVFYPCIRVKPVNPRAKKVRAYFPGYMFVRADVERLGVSFFQYMSYAKGLVSFGGEPSVVPDELISTLKVKLNQMAQEARAPEDLPAGQPVIIQDGPFSGYEAIFDTRISGTERVRVLLRLLSDRQIPVEIHRDKIVKKKNSSG